ncbi:unnamed protein product, partial [Closterium sp. NIES-53]
MEKDLQELRKGDAGTSSQPAQPRQPAAKSRNTAAHTFSLNTDKSTTTAPCPSDEVINSAQARFLSVSEIKTTTAFDDNDFYTWSFELELLLQTAQIRHYFDGSYAKLVEDIEDDRAQYYSESLMVYSVLLRNVTPAEQLSIRSYKESAAPFLAQRPAPYLTPAPGSFPRPAPYLAPARQHLRPAPCLAPRPLGPSAPPQSPEPAPPAPCLAPQPPRPLGPPRPPRPLVWPAAPRPLGPTSQHGARPPLPLVWPLGPLGPSAPPQSPAPGPLFGPSAPVASLRVLPFDPDSRPVAFDTWHDDLQLYLLSDLRDSVSLFDHVSGAAPAPPATADVSTHS